MTESARPDRIDVTKRTMLINTSSSLCTRVISLTVLVWLQQYLLKRISPEEYSLLPIVASVTLIIPVLASVLVGGLSRFITEALARDDHQRITEITSTMLTLLLGAAAVLLIVGSALVMFLGDLLTIAPEHLADAQLMLGLMIFLAAVRLPTAPYECGLYALQRFVELSIIGLGAELFRVALLCVLLVEISPRILWVVVASVCAESAGILITIHRSRRGLPAIRFKKQRINWLLAPELLSFGGWSFVASVAGAIRNGSDAIILNKLGTAVDVTCFYLGSLPKNKFQHVFGSLRAPMQPAIIAMHARNQQARISRVYLRGGRYALWISLLVMVPPVVFARELITLYVGDEFQAAAPVFVLLALLFPLAYGNNFLPHIAHATANLRPLAILEFCAHTTNFLLTLWFVGYWHLGALGSALGSVVAAAFFHPLFLWPLGNRLAQVTFGQWVVETMVPGLLPAVVTASVLMAVRWHLRPETWAPLLAVLAAGAILYLVIVATCLRPEDRSDLRDALHALMHMRHGRIA